MANLRGMNSVGNALTRFLTQSYNESKQANDPDFTFQQVATGALTSEFNPDKVLTLMLYRITWSEHSRQALKPGFRRAPVALELHYLLTAWAKDAALEHFMMSWTLAQLHRFPALDRAMLPADAGWADDDRIEVAPCPLSQEELSRVWDRLLPNYRLSVAYTARVLRIDIPDPDDSKPVVVRKFDYQEMPA